MTFNENLHPRRTSGEFAAKAQTEPELAIVNEHRRMCTEGCGRAAEYRLGNIPNGYRTENDAQLCSIHAAQWASEGSTIVEFPRPQEPGERILWLVEGDDHEVEMVEATSERAALELACDAFRGRYDDDDDDDDAALDLLDNLTVVGAFRGELGGLDDEFEFVPFGDVDENTAYAKLQNL